MEENKEIKMEDIVQYCSQYGFFIKEVKYMGV